MIVIAAKNGPKIWGYARLPGKFVSFWGSNGKVGGTDEKASEAYFASLWKQKRTNSAGFKEITLDELREALPDLPAEFYE